VKFIFNILYMSRKFLNL